MSKANITTEGIIITSESGDNYTEAPKIKFYSPVIIARSTTVKVVTKNGKITGFIIKQNKIVPYNEKI